LRESEKEANGDGGEDEDDHAADDGDWDAPPAKDLVMDVVADDPGLLPCFLGGADCEQADAVRKEGFQRTSD
jgi:hypothetical protein